MASNDGHIEPASNRLDNPGLATNEQLTEPQATSAVSQKRKATDRNLQIITIDPHFDLTLIVGTPEHPGGQRALRVNRGSMRNVSDVWTKMLIGDWAERDQLEIELPDDEWETMSLVLRMAHLQFDQLPNTLSLLELALLARLTNKYNLGRIVRVVLEMKNWWLPYKAEWTAWPANPRLLNFTFVALDFQLYPDYDYMVNKLAMEVRVNENQGHFYYGVGKSLTQFSNDKLDPVVIRISKIRNSILQEWIDCCKTAVSNALKGQETDKSGKPIPSKCSKELCQVTRSGIITNELQSAGLYPIPESPRMMYQSVAWYWRRLKTIGTKFRPYCPYDKGLQQGYPKHVSSCSFDKCFGDFGIVSKAEATLKQYAHEEVFTYLQSDEFLKATL